MVGLQPPPTCRDIILRNKYLEESLGASFAADERAIRFSKGSGRENEFSFLGGRVGKVIEDDHVRGCLEERSPLPRRCARR